MDHLILLVLCWIFVAVASVAAVTQRKHIDPLDELEFADFMAQAMKMGTVVWLALEGVYYVAITYVF